MISTKSLKVEASRDLEEKLISPVKSAVWTGTDLKTSAPEAVAVPGELEQHSPAPVQADPRTETSDSGLTVTQSASAKTTRSSLQASTWDGVFAAIFANIAGGVLLSNFLVELEASTVQLGMVMAIPMLVNLIQPLGAYLANQTTSRHWYGLIVFIPARLLWLFLVLGILVAGQQVSPNTLIQWTFGIVLVSNILAALGSASWFSWMTTLVPARLRGCYFGIRNSAVSLCTLVSVPLAAWGVSAWPGGTLQGYGVILLLGTLAGLLSVGFQYWMKDVNPQAQAATLPEAKQQSTAAIETLEVVPTTPAKASAWQDPNLINFLIYFGFWAFAINLSSPFFNIYLLDNLGLDVRWVTLYNSLTAGTNLLMLIFWGKLSDRSGNRPLLLLVGILVALTPLFWLGIGTDALSLWLWLPLLHIFMGSTWPAIELCSNNIQMAIAPVKNHATFFAIAAAVAGGCGACGTLLGGSLAQLADYGGLPGMFALSSVLRLAALLPLIFVHEHRGQSLIQMAQTITAGVRPLLKPLPVKMLALPARVKS